MVYMNPARIHSLTIHCTATPEGRDNTALEVEKWDIERFGQPSYHWVIELDGEARMSLRDDQKGAHTGGRNTGNIGVAYVGGTTSLNSGAKPKDTRTKEQKETLRRIVQEYKDKYPHIVVKGHRDWEGVKKACPSFDVETEL